MADQPMSIPPLLRSCFGIQPTQPPPSAADAGTTGPVASAPPAVGGGAMAMAMDVADPYYPQQQRQQRQGQMAVVATSAQLPSVTLQPFATGFFAPPDVPPPISPPAPVSSQAPSQAYAFANPRPLSQVPQPIQSQLQLPSQPLQQPQSQPQQPIPIANANTRDLPSSPLKATPASATSTTPGTAGLPAAHTPSVTSATAVTISPESAASAAAASTASHTASHNPASSCGGHKNNSSLYQCADCHRRYSRSEHLARHIQSHTLGKRFLCSTCNKGFARADLLKRHAANHENDHDPRKRRRAAASALPVARVSQACRACATARVKCEETKPCARCKNRGRECELGPSEPGSTAALHLLSLSHPTPSTLHHTSAPASSSADHANQDSHGGGAQQSDVSPDGSSYKDSPHTVGNSTAQEFDESPLSSHPSVTKFGSPQKPSGTIVTAKPYPGQSALLAQQAQPQVPDMGTLPFTNSLQGIMYEPGLDPSQTMQAEGMTVLNFCNNNNAELDDLDFNLIDYWNLADGLPALQPGAQPQALAAPGEELVDLSELRQTLVKIFTSSPCRWQPTSHDSGYQEQANFSVSSQDVAGAPFQESRDSLNRVVNQKLDSGLRDRVLAAVLSTCKSPPMTTRVASSFPSTEVMDTLVHIFLAAHLCSVSSWIHFPLFNMSAQWPDWIAVAAAAGGVLTPVPTLRKFGLALQEAIRLTIQTRFEEANTSIQNIGLLQTLILGQDIGLWSGNRRKMEIAESHLVIPITMMRYRGKFQRASYPAIEVSPADNGRALAEKWQLWSERESWKRLVFHCFVREGQVSMIMLTNPALSYSELSLPLPESRMLWAAKSPEEWKARYLERSAGQPKRPPSICDLFRDGKLLVLNQGRLDVQYSISIWLHGFWQLILEYRNLNAVLRSRPAFDAGAGNDPQKTLLAARRLELFRALEAFQLTVSELPHPLLAQESLVLHFLLMNLHVSPYDLRLFSGTEGEEQARRVYPILRQWVATEDARRAVWHAGQVIRHAKLFPSSHIKEFYAIAVYLAAQALWTYGVIGRAAPPFLYRGGAALCHPQDTGSVCVDIDGPETPAVMQFISVGAGQPVINGLAPPTPAVAGNDAGRLPVRAPLDDPKACMEAVQQVLQSSFAGTRDMPPAIVENLCPLIARLGDVGGAVGFSKPNRG